MPALFWTAIGFALGALPFSLWIGRWATGRDIRAFGDHNPGATNVLRAGGRWAAAAALLLDMAKGAFPVGMAFHVLTMHDAWLIPLALAPILGHAFSPLLRSRGGKAVAVTGGVWTGLTAWEAPLVGSVTLLLGTRLFGGNGWAVLFAMTGILSYLLVAPPAWNPWIDRPDRATLLIIWAANVAILVWTHRMDLQIPPRLRLGRAFRRDA